MRRADHQESRAMRRMAGAVVALESSEDAAKRRALLVPKLAASIERAARMEARRRRLRVGFLVMAAAAVLLLTLGLGWAGWNRSDPAATVSLEARVESADGMVTVTHAGADAPAGAQSLAGDDEVRTDGDGQAVLLLASGAKVTLRSSTLVKMGSAASAGEAVREEVRLTAGRIGVQVPKLGPGGSFEVVTADARVRVHGTRFSVEVGKREGEAYTQVEVTEGLVAVHHDGGVAMLGVGAAWSTATEREMPSVPATASAAIASTASAPPAAPKVASVPKSAETTPPKSSLAAENALFQAALRAGRQGDDERALALLNEFLTKYPSSPLAQNVRVERFRALARLGRDKAASTEARRYMAEHPEGFASEEARDIVMPPPSSSRNDGR